MKKQILFSIFLFLLFWDLRGQSISKEKTAKITSVGDAVVRNSAGTMIRGSSIPKQPFKIYTNPDRELLIVQYENANKKAGMIKVSDIKGNLIREIAVTGVVTKLSLNTQSWKNGAYTIVLSEKETRQTIMQTILLNR